MTEPETHETASEAEDAHETWECRFFLPQLPALFSAENLARMPFRITGPFVEHDLYLLGRDATTNFKIRQKTNRIKLKVLLEKEPDGFQLWRMELESQLPCPAPLWRDILAHLQMDGDPQSLAQCSTREEVVRVLRDLRPSLLSVAMEKSRTVYAAEHAYLEVGEVAIRGKRLRSVEFKSADLARARELRSRFAALELGVPESYVSFVMRLLGRENHSPSAGGR